VLGRPYDWDFVLNGPVFGLARRSVGRSVHAHHSREGIDGPQTNHLLSPVTSGAVLLGWTLALALAGLALRSDET